MFNRKIRDKLPCLKRTLELGGETNFDEEIRDRDREAKWNMKQYADSKRKAKISGIAEGDIVILKRQAKTNKHSSTYEPIPYKVIGRRGAEILVEQQDTKKRYRRNVIHGKKIDNDAYTFTREGHHIDHNSHQQTTSELHLSPKSSPSPPSPEQAQSDQLADPEQSEPEIQTCSSTTNILT